MKTERRHELQTNQLADWVGHQIEHVTPHAKTILAAGILGAAVIVVSVVVIKDRERSREIAWTEFHAANGVRDPEALASVAKQHEGTVIALWALQTQADVNLNQGVSALYINRNEAQDKLADARKAYKQVVDQAASYPELMQHSLFGLAQANEASSNLEAARGYYEQVAQKFPDSAIGKQAAARLVATKDPSVEKWYNWFGSQKPKPSSPLSMPQVPGMSGSSNFPSDLTKLPESPDLSPAAPAGPEVTAPATPQAPPVPPVIPPTAAPPAPSTAPAVPPPTLPSTDGKKGEAPKSEPTLPGPSPPAPPPAATLPAPPATDSPK